VPDKDREINNKAPEGQVAQTVQLVKDYARQELRDPLGNTGRWIGLGLLGALCIGVATGFLALGLLRMLQTEWPGTFGGRWTMLVPYLFGLLFAGVVIGLAVLRINKQPLTKEQG
jgi:hypothetical protein